MDDRGWANLTVMSPNGQVVLRNTLDAQEARAEVNLEGLANGVYMMQYESEVKIKTYRIVLQSE